VITKVLFFDKIRRGNPTKISRLLWPLLTTVPRCQLMPRLHMQVWQPGIERKACKKYFLVVKPAHVFEEDRKPASYCKQEIW